MLAVVLYVSTAAVVMILLIFWILPLIVAVWATLRRSFRHFKHSKLYVGQVWHTRLQPKVHSFHYPIFMFALDLEESFHNFLWPIVRFESTRDHLKNGEGLLPKQEASSNSSSSNSNSNTNALSQRILRLVSTKTQGKFQPSLTTHRIMLLTHLEYFGYNFNPVSFYYIIQKSTNQVDAMVGEVSNTPWTEMYCYVLHPESVDRVQLQSANAGLPTTTGPVKDYRFAKEFHVSPFMEMEYWYDWTFQGVPGDSPAPAEAGQNVYVVNSMRQRSGKEDLVFTAKLQLTAQSMTPWNVVWQLIRFPMFCMIIQIWIHYQAAWLFVKGVVYVPHPQGSETRVSKAIAAIMTPFFAARDYLSPKNKTA